MAASQTHPPKQPLPEYLQEDLRQECREIISILPKIEGGINGHLYLYQGFWYPSRVLQGVLTCQNHFEAQDGDTFLLTSPKSGTTWMQAVIFALINRAQYSNPQKHPLLTHNPHSLVPLLDVRLYAKDDDPDLTSSLSSKRIFALHMPFSSLPKSIQDSDCKIIYVCRNPKDVFVSLWHFENQLHKPLNADPASLEGSFEKFCRGESMFGPLWDHVLGYWRESLLKPDKVLFLKYEDIMQEPHMHFDKIAKFLGCPFSEEEERQGVMQQIVELCSFENLRSLEVNKNGKLQSGEENSVFFRRGQVGDWENYLKPEMAEQLDRITEEKLHGSRLVF